MLVATVSGELDAVAGRCLRRSAVVPPRRTHAADGTRVLVCIRTRSRTARADAIDYICAVSKAKGSHRSDHKSMELSSRGAFLRVSLIFASGVAINKLSDVVSISAPLVITLALITLIIMINYERSSGATQAKQARARRSGVESNFALVELALSALLLGAAAGGVAVIPILRTLTLDWPPGATYYSYEFAAFVVIEALAILGAYRTRSIMLSSSFVIAAVAGMSLAVVFVKPENDFTATFLGWSLTGLLLTFVALHAGSMFRQLRLFFLGGAR